MTTTIRRIFGSSWAYLLWIALTLIVMVPIYWLFLAQSGGAVWFAFVCLHRDLAQQFYQAAFRPNLSRLSCQFGLCRHKQCDIGFNSGTLCHLCAVTLEAGRCRQHLFLDDHQPHGTTRSLFVADLFALDIMDGIPIEIDEAAFVDGANRWMVLWRIITPLAAPGLAVTGILSWVFAWNEYLFAATLTSVDARTIPTRLAEYVTTTGTNWGEMAAVAFIALLPALLFLAFVQRYIVIGLTFGAVKE